MNALRRSAWLAGAPLRAVLLAAIWVYRLTLSGMLGGQCRFAPTCSHYAEDAIRARGAIAGTALATWRVLRCNPYGAGGLDPAPATPAWRAVSEPLYDEVTRRPRAPRRLASEGAAP